MQAYIKVWMAGLLVASVSVVGSTAVRGEEFGQPRYALSGPTSSQVPADFEARMAAMEAQVAKFADEAAADKKRAAGRPSVQVGGRIFADVYAYDQNANSLSQIGNQQDGFRFDSVRIYVKGGAFHVMEYMAEVDFAGTQDDYVRHDPFDGVRHDVDLLQAPTFKDVYIAVNELPLVGNVKLGHFKEPFSLDQLTDSRFITFMERSLMDEPFVPGRNVGAMIYDHTDSQNLTWALGGFISNFDDDLPIYQAADGGLAATTRITYLPWYDEATDGRGLLHLGVAYSYRDIDGVIQRRTKPEADLGDYLIGTGPLSPASEQLIGFEAAVVYGAFRIQSEYTRIFVQEESGSSDSEFDGFYAQASYFLTGEQRKYQRSNGTFSDRVVPFEDFFRVRDADGRVQNGIGAWELAYRVSHADLTPWTGFPSGRATNHTLGINWYLNRYSRLMFNYINSDARRDAARGPHGNFIDGNMHIFMTRFQIDY